MPIKGIMALFSGLPDDNDLIVMAETKLFNYKQIFKKPNVHAIGYKRGNERFEYLASADAIIVPSILEPFGLICLEAMMLKIPLIVSYNDGIGTWLDKNAAYNCGSNEITIKKCIEEFKHNPTKNVEYAYNFASAFTVEKMTNQIKDIFKIECKK